MREILREETQELLDFDFGSTKLQDLLNRWDDLENQWQEPENRLLYLLNRWQLIVKQWNGLQGQMRGVTKSGQSEPVNNIV